MERSFPAHSVSLQHAREERDHGFFDDDAEDDDHHRPCEQIRRFKGDAGIRDHFSDGDQGEQQRLGGDACFPRHSETGAETCEEIGADGGEVDVLDAGGGAHFIRFCHFEEGFVGVSDAAFHVAPHHRHHHHGGDDQRRFVAADPQHEEEDEGCHGGRFHHGEEGREEVSCQAGACGEGAAEDGDCRADQHSEQDARKRDGDGLIEARFGHHFKEPPTHGKRRGEEKLFPHRHCRTLPDAQPEEGDQRIFQCFFDHFP